MVMESGFYKTIVQVHFDKPHYPEDNYTMLRLDSNPSRHFVVIEHPGLSRDEFDQRVREAGCDACITIKETFEWLVERGYATRMVGVKKECDT